MAVDLSLDADQLLLQRSAHDYFRTRYPSEVVRALDGTDPGYDATHWRELAALGWLGIAIPEAYGGGGGSFLDLVPIYEEMGRFLVPSPHLDTVAVAGEVVLAAGTTSQRERVLPAIAAGELVVSPAIMEADGCLHPASVTCSARREAGAYVVSGTKLLVPFATAADELLCAVRTGPGEGRDGVSLLLVDSRADGVTCSALPNIAGHPLHEVRFDDVVVPADHLVGRDGEGWEVLTTATLKAAVLQTATIVGAGRAVLDMTNQYAKDREQFGNPIGRYQAVQYLVSDILIDVHRADLLTRQAAFRIAADKPHEREASIAAAFGKRAAAHLHRQAHEVHAGVAFIDEHDLTLYSRRSKFWEHHLGDARHYEERLARAMGI